MKENPPKTTIFLFLISIGALIYLYSCTNAKSSKKNNTKLPATSHAVQYKKPSSSYNDTLVINNISAVFYNPDSLQLNKIQAITEKDLYETDVHNCFYLMRNARIVLKKYWPRIHIIESSEYRYLLFIKTDNSQTCIDLNSKEDMCGIFVFDRKKEPELIDMMNIDTDLGFYFK